MEDNSHRPVCLLSEKGSTLDGTNLLHLRANSFLLEFIPFSGEAYGKSQKFVSVIQNVRTSKSICTFSYGQILSLKGGSLSEEAVQESKREVKKVVSFIQNGGIAMQSL